MSEKIVQLNECLGISEALGEVFPESKYQRCTVHFYRNVFSVTPRSKVKLVARMLKSSHAQESKNAAREKEKVVVEVLFKFLTSPGVPMAIHFTFARVA